MSSALIASTCTFSVRFSSSELRKDARKPVTMISAAETPVSFALAEEEASASDVASAWDCAQAGPAIPASAMPLKETVRRRLVLVFDRLSATVLSLCPADTSLRRTRTDGGKPLRVSARAFESARIASSCRPDDLPRPADPMSA